MSTPGYDANTTRLIRKVWDLRVLTVAEFDAKYPNEPVNDQDEYEFYNDLDSGVESKLVYLHTLFTGSLRYDRVPISPRKHKLVENPHFPVTIDATIMHFGTDWVRARCDLHDDLSLTDKPYRTASYLAEVHPDAVNDPLGDQIEQLYIELKFCGRCGAVVHDERVHDAWHQEVTK